MSMTNGRTAVFTLDNTPWSQPGSTLPWEGKTEFCCSESIGVYGLQRVLSHYFHHISVLVHFLIITYFIKNKENTFPDVVM